MNDDGRLDAAMRRAFGGGGPEINPRGIMPASTAFEERYVVHEVLGEGGMGIVHRATDLVLEREVALKFLRGGHAGTIEQIRRFIGEARLAARVVHPGIVPIYDRGVTADGRPYIAMRLVEGQTLKQRLAQIGDHWGERRQLVAVIERVAQAVAAAHAASVVHRDLKPSNVMLGPFGEVLVMDFGLARMESGDVTSDVDNGAGCVAPGHTGSGAILGTPAYMSPEQRVGNAALAGRRSDVYALGAMLFELFEPERPVDPSALRAALAARDCEPELAALILECLAPEPDDRPETAGIVADRLAAWSARQEERATEARHQAALAAAGLEAGRRRRRLWMVMMVIVVSAAATISWVMKQSADERAEHQRQLDDDAAAATAAAEVAVAKAGAGAPHDPLPWREARTLAEIAEKRSRAAESPLVRRRAAAVRAAALAGLSSAEAEAAVLAADREMIRQLDVIAAWSPTYRDWTADLRRYREAFRGYGIPLDPAPAKGIESRLCASRIRPRLVRALLDCARATEASQESDTAARWLFELARDVADAPEAREWIDLRLGGKAGELVSAFKVTDLRRFDPQAVAIHCDWLLRHAPIDEVIDVARRLQQAHPASADAEMSLERALEVRGRTVDLLEAARCAAATAALQPDEPHLPCVVAICLQRAGQLPEAEAILRRLREANPANATVAHFLGLLLLQSDRVDEARVEYERAVALGSTVPETLCNLAVILCNGPDPIRGEGLFRDVMERSPRLIEARIGLGRSLSLRGNVDEAIAFLGGATRDAPDSAEAWLAYGQALASRRRFKAAADALERGRQLATPARRAKTPSLDGAIAELRAKTDRLATIPLRTITDPDEQPDVHTLLDLALYYRDLNDVGTASSISRLVVERDDPPPDISALWIALTDALPASRRLKKPELRADALRWLEQALALALAQPSAAESRRAGTADLLDWWLTGTSLRGVRDPAAREDLPADEAARWDALFRRIRDARDGLRPPK